MRKKATNVNKSKNFQLISVVLLLSILSIPMFFISLTNNTNSLVVQEYRIEKVLNKPISQQSQNPVVIDGEGEIWDYTTRYNIEENQLFIATATWNESVINANLSAQEYIGSSWVDLSPTAIFYSQENGTNTTTFKIHFTSNYLKIPKRFRISAYLNDTKQEITTEWQEYDLIESESPIILTSHSAEYSVITLDNATGKLGIKISFSDLFTDTGGIANFTIAKKSADDGVKITTTNFDSVSTYFTTTNTTFIDDSIAPEDFSKFYYAIRAEDYANNPSSVYTINDPLSTDIFPPTIESYQLIINDTKVDDGIQVYPKGIFNFRLTTQIDCSGGNISLVNTDTKIIPYEKDLSEFGDSGLVWQFSIDLGRPRSTAGEMKPGHYDLYVQLEDDMGNINIIHIENVFNIIAFGETPEEGPNYTLYGIIGGLAVAALIVIIVIKKKKEAISAEGDGEPEIEFTKGPVKKRKGKIYRGASSIGRASGQAAEDLQRRRGAAPTKTPNKKSSKTTKSIKTSKTTTKSTKTINKNKVGTSEVRAKVSPASTKNLADSEKDLDKILSNETTPMKLKLEEKKVDLGRRIEFVDSKIIALEQNEQLMKVILEQVKTLKTETRECPNCKRQIPVYWSECAYCKLDQSQQILAEKQNNYNPIGQQKICPVCRKVLDKSWDRCPYCFVKKQGI